MMGIHVKCIRVIMFCHLNLVSDAVSVPLLESANEKCVLTDYALCWANKVVRLKVSLGVLV